MHSGISPRVVGSNWLAVAAALTSLIAGFSAVTAHAQAQRPCLIQVANAPSVVIDSYAGEVSVNGRRLQSARDYRLCPGDEIRTGPIGRVAIRFDAKRTIIRLDGNSRAKIPEQAFELTGEQARADISLFSGLLYFLSSVRRRFRVDTPYIVAGIEGTEALVLAELSRRLAIAAVRQGVVDAYSQRQGPRSTLAVHEGEAAFTSAAVRFQKAPIAALPPSFRDLLIISDSSVDWAVYYPQILLAPDADRAVRSALYFMHTGDYDQAERILGASAASEPATSAALRTIIAVGRNRLDEARRWSVLALRSGRNASQSHIAASYERQANGDLTAAIDFAVEATRISPDDAYALARLAELQMTVGDRIAALATARRSLAIAPTPLALFVAGLADLAAADYERAEAQFRRATDLDPQAPLPRLGLGLAFIRQGRIAAGAWEIERALAHDPRRAAIRTWLGRAYFDEGQVIESAERSTPAQLKGPRYADQNSGRQAARVRRHAESAWAGTVFYDNGLAQKAADHFRIAQGDDPQDPQPYLYAALGKYSANQILGALDDVMEAEKRGAGRRVLRSGKGLGEDAATRGAALGRLYDTLSFTPLAVVTGSKATDADPADPGAHRFLADVYRSRPDHDIARTSELLRSQLLSPPSKTPVQPQLAEARLALLDTTGPSRVSFAEFSSLFNSDGLRFDASALYGTQGTKSAEAAVTGLYKNAALSVGTFHYLTDGYRANNDLSHDIFNAVGKIALTPEFVLFGEYRRRESEGGDRRLNFDLEFFAPNFRAREKRRISRFGFHARPTANSDLIGVYTRGHVALSASDELGFFGSPFIILTEDNQSAHSGQLQHIHHAGRLRSVVGGSFLTTKAITTGSFGGIPFPALDLSSEYYNGYAYFNFDLPAGVNWTLGGSVVHYRQDAVIDLEFTQLHPKLGASIELTDYITLRGSYLRSMKPNLVTEQTIEPTTIAGFNQYYDSFDGSVLEQAGGGIDIKTNYRVWLGGEVVRRWWDITSSEASDPRTKEDINRAYVAVALSDSFALSAEVREERIRSTAAFEFPAWRTLSAPVTLSYFGNRGIFAALRTEYVNHKVPGSFGMRKDAFTITSATLGLRLPKNSGIFSIEGRNLLDTRFNFQNRTFRPDLSARPRYAPRRTIYARGTFRF